VWDARLLRAGLYMVGLREGVGEHAAATPGLIDGQMPAIMLPGEAEMVLHRGHAADGADCMHKP